MRKISCLEVVAANDPYLCSSCGGYPDPIRWLGDGVMRCQCGNEWQYQPVSDPVQIDEPLYHVAPTEARDSIVQNGLERYTEGVYLEREPEHHRWREWFGPGHDVWQVDARGLPIHEGELDGLIVPQDIPPERLKLMGEG